MTYSLEIELFLETDSNSLKVLHKGNLTAEECLRESLKWRLRPFQDSIKHINIHIQPDMCEEVNFSASSSGGVGETIMPTHLNQSVENNEWSSSSSIKKQIKFSYYGKFLHFLKTFCLKNENGTFKLEFHLNETKVKSCQHFMDQILDYERKVKCELLEHGKVSSVNFSKKDTDNLCNLTIGLGAFGVVFKTTEYFIRGRNKTRLTINNGQTELCGIFATKTIPLRTISTVNSVNREIYILDMISKNDALKNHVVKYFGSCVDDEYLYIIMEYISGPNLNEYIVENYNQFNQSLQEDEEKIKSASDILKIVNHLCKGLTMLHYIGISHRDIKPGNIIVDNDGNFKFVDFGFSALSPNTKIDSNIRVTDMLKWENKVMGTYRFAAPEVLSFEFNIDWFKADMWSLGTVLYYVMTGNQFLERSSKNRHKVLNILYNKMEECEKPLHIPLYKSVFDISKTNMFVRQTQRHLKKCVRHLLEYMPSNRKIIF